MLEDRARQSDAEYAQKTGNNAKNVSTNYARAIPTITQRVEDEVAMASSASTRYSFAAVTKTPLVNMTMAT